MCVCVCVCVCVYIYVCIYIYMRRNGNPLQYSWLENPMDGGRGVSEFLQILTVCLVAQLCLTLCNPMDCCLPGSSVHGDSPGKNPHWSGVPGPPPGDLSHPGREPVSLMSPASAGGFFTISATYVEVLP